MQHGLAKTILISSLLLSTSPSLHAEEFILSIDKYYSPYMGANWLISAERGYEALDDILLAGTVGDCSIPITLGRMAKWGFEFTLFSWGMVTQDEVFGHGARAREFHANDINYRVYPFHGQTRITSGYLQPNQRAAFEAGGMEATSILGQQYEREWMRYEQLDSRAATFYLVNMLDQSANIFGTSGGFLRADNSIDDYRTAVNAWHNSNALTNNSLKGDLVWDWVNPMFYFSAYSIARYMWVGEQLTDFGTLHIGDAAWMPTTRVLLAPYGPEFELLNNLFTPNEKFIGVNFRFGRTGGVNSYGADLFVDPLKSFDCWSFSNKLSIWYQPHLLKNDTAAQNSNKWGFADFINAKFSVSKSVAAFGEIGYKVSGFLPGTQLSSGVIWRLGFILGLDVKKKVDPCVIPQI